MIEVIQEVRGAYTYVVSSYLNIIKVGNEVLNADVTTEITAQETIINDYIYFTTQSNTTMERIETINQ